MNENLEHPDLEPEEPEEEEDAPGFDFSFGQKAAVGITTALTVCGADALIHAPLPITIGGLIGAYLLARKSPVVYEALREILPLPDLSAKAKAGKEQQTLPSEWTLMDRLMGKHLDVETGQPLPRLPAPTSAREEIPASLSPDLDAQLEQIRQQITTARRGPMAGHLYLGEQFNPHADTILSNRVTILGMPGAGKSNTVADLCEELARLRAPLFIFDQKPEYGRMADFFPNGLCADASLVTPANAFQFAQTVVKKRLQVVLNLRSYKDDNAAAQVMIAILAGVWTWEEALTNDERLPCTFVLDEAHYWLPQGDHLSTVSRVKDKEGRSLLTKLQTAFFNVVNGGRSFGLGMIISTQRPANIDNRAIAVAEWRILLKANMPNDLKVYKEFGVDAETAMKLGPGQAYLIGPGEIRGVYQLRRRYTPDDSKTPGLAALQGKPSRPSAPAQTVFPSSLPEMHMPGQPPMPTSWREEALTTMRLPETEAEGLIRGLSAREEGAYLPTRHFTTGLPPELQCAHEAYQPGMDRQALAAELGIEVVTAARYLRQLRERRYLDSHGRKVNPTTVRKPTFQPGDASATPHFERGSQSETDCSTVAQQSQRDENHSGNSPLSERPAMTVQRSNNSTFQTSPDEKFEKSDEKFEKYRFTEAEKPRVIDLYKAYRSIDKVLAHMERGSFYYKHASEILKEAGLLKERKRG